MSSTTADVVIVGAGLTGLAHAFQACALGLRVTVVEQDDTPLGTSLSASGHLSVTALGDDVAARAHEIRDGWLRIADRVGFPVSTAGSVIVARTAAEVAVIEELAARRAGDQVLPLSPHEAHARTGIELPGVVAAALLPLDLVVDPRVLLPALISWLEDEGVRFLWRTRVATVVSDAGADGPVEVTTNRGQLRARWMIHCGGPDTLQLFPDLAEAGRLSHCHVHSLEVRADGARHPMPALLSGMSMLAYPGLTDLAATDEVFEEVDATAPELLAAGTNLTVVPRSDGNLVLGATHCHDDRRRCSDDGSESRLLLREGERLLGTPLHPVASWGHSHAAAARGAYFVASPSSSVRVVTALADTALTTLLDRSTEVVAGL